MTHNEQNEPQLMSHFFKIDKNNKMAYYSHFLTLERTFITLFWALFGLSNHEGVELPSYPVNRICGYWLYGIYNFLIVVLMLNMYVYNTYVCITYVYNTFVCNST